MSPTLSCCFGTLWHIKAPHHLHHRNAMPHKTLLVGWKLLLAWNKEPHIVPSVTHCLSTFLPHQTTSVPPRFCWSQHLFSYLWLANIVGWKEPLYLFLFFGRLPHWQPTPYHCTHHTQCPSSSLRAPNQRGWLTAAIKWPPGKTSTCCFESFIVRHN